MLAIVTVATSFVAIHCSSTRGAFEPEPVDEPPGTGTFVDGAAAHVDAAEPLPDCPDENKLIYVVTAEMHGQGEKRLYRFAPETLTFTSIGRLNCPTTSDTHSMAVDRRGTAWVAFKDGRIFKVSTKDASCAPTTYRPGQHGFQEFGMSFAKDDSEAGVPVSETLYLSGPTLARLDLSTFEISIVGAAPGTRAELTGTGAGTLYAFTQPGSHIVRLDKTTGGVLETYRPDVPMAFAWAFAHWGGDFWVFANTEFGGRSRVTRYSPATKTSMVVVEDTGTVIIGAGASTCAPSEPPR